MYHCTSEQTQLFDLGTYVHRNEGQSPDVLSIAAMSFVIVGIRRAKQNPSNPISGRVHPKDIFSLSYPRECKSLEIR